MPSIEEVEQMIDELIYDETATEPSPKQGTNEPTIVQSEILTEYVQQVALELATSKPYKELMKAMLRNAYPNNYTLNVIQTILNDIGEHTHVVAEVQEIRKNTDINKFTYEVDLRINITNPKEQHHEAHRRR